MGKTEKALRWILGIIEKYGGQYQISGGFAARLHGATRELDDIDVDVPHDTFQKAIEDIRPYIFWGPAGFQDKNWNLVYAKLDYEGQKIDLCDGDNFKIVDDRTGEIVIDGIDFSKVVQKEVFGIPVKVMSKEELIAYKSVLGRDVDKIDIEQLNKVD
jgi:hypothetical protein